MTLRALSEFVAAETDPAEIASFTGGHGILLPPDVRAEITRVQSGSTLAELTAGVVSLRNLMPGGDLFHTALLALLCGTMVENGADPGAAIDATLQLLLRLLEALSEDPDETTRAAAQLAIPAAMTMLCRSKETRKRWRARPDVLELLDDLEDSELVPSFLREVFTLHDDLDLLVLDRKNRRAFEFRLTAVRDRLYHCYALLQDALLRHTGPGYLDAEPVDPLAVRYARNHALTPADYAASAHLLDYQRFNFAPPGFMFMPGSASPSELPLLEGMALLLVEPKGMHTQWRPSNMYPVVHEALEAGCELVREHDREHTERLLGRLGI
ncbi:hypothetical protein [Nocardia inohanensis]|uniref:hypothetical protein n=1 Tax=Nocardia inohanensis TaxID=209246 RepID=UPI0008350FF9|nr:hypothetical protein [Nocardia inohanensis]